MTHVGYLIAGWGSVVTISFAYGVSVIVRGRKLAEKVPEDRRRWMTTKDATEIGVS
ncbi:MAG: hypothetical protein HKN94_08625 [Acidimicrobiales bacterium]|nr:hypothetical protein [Acidimicrobiales bacterium]